MPRLVAPHWRASNNPDLGSHQFYGKVSSNRVMTPLGVVTTVFTTSPAAQPFRVIVIAVPCAVQMGDSVLSGADGATAGTTLGLVETTVQPALPVTVTAIVVPKGMGLR